MTSTCLFNLGAAEASVNPWCPGKVILLARRCSPCFSRAGTSHSIPAATLYVQYLCIACLRLLVMETDQCAISRLQLHSLCL